MGAVLVLNTPDDGRLRPKHVERPCRNKTCTVLHQVGVSFDVYFCLDLALVPKRLLTSAVKRVSIKWHMESEISVKVQILGLMLNRHPALFFIITNEMHN